MNIQPAIRRSCLGVLLLAALASACSPGDERAVKGRDGSNGTARDTVSDLALTEDGLGQIQIGMTLDEAVSMGLLNDNPSMRSECDFVFPAVGAGIPDGVSAMVEEKGRAHRCHTGLVTNRDGAKMATL